MAIDVVLDSVGSGYNRQKIDINFTKIQEALQNAIDRTGNTPNEMEVDLDLNDNDLLNVSTLRTTRLFIDGQEVVTGLLSKGNKGWSPNLGISEDGARRVFRLISWVGGEGDAPTIGINQYLGASGFTSVIADAIDVRGPQGASGPGSGDLVAASNLSDIANPATAFANIIQVASTAEVRARSSNVKVLAPTNYTAFFPIGTVLDYTGPTAPPLFLFPYGQAVSRTTYAEYFAIVGTTYGAGDGSTTFNLPDLRGRVVAGKSDMGGSNSGRLTGASGGVTGTTLGAAGGAETHVLTIDQLAKHGHPWVYSHTNDFDGGNYGGWVMESTGLETRSAWNGTPSPNAGQQIGGTGSDAAHNNVQPTFILNKILFVGV